jgi:phage baseplate assembly protein W
MADIPHFRIPFQIIGGQAATIEQDSEEDILTCVETILRTQTGDRVENPDFGVEDLTFQTNPAQITEETSRAIKEFEPRADTITETEIADLTATVRIGAHLA